MDVCNDHSWLPSTRWPNVCRYEVFLSFRGEDVRRGFIEFLYQGLVDSGISTFIDYDGIGMGEEIMDKIFQVIGHSEICIPIFSKDFASSKSCLNELEKMVGCDRTIMPIFYDASPSVVGQQQESYQQSFCNHAAKGVESGTINKWKEALLIVSRKRGWELEKFQHGDHELIREVVSTVRQLLRKDELDVTEHLVGMDHHVQEMMRKLGVQYENGRVVEGQALMGKRVVEISGLSGIGKSTLAKIVYNKIHPLFEGCCSFLSDIHGKVEERRLLSLQEDLISDLQKKRCTLKSSAEGTAFIKYKFRNLRVLIVLDDVTDFEQIDSLARNLSWFGPGSRIMVISMRSNLVDKYSQLPVENYESPETGCLSVLGPGSQMLDRRSSVVDICNGIIVEKYELKPMNDGHAFQLFCKYALRGKPLREEFSSLARDISLATGGLPSVIQVVGSSLYEKPITFWEEALDRLKREPFNKEVKRILKRRYDALEGNAQQIFLDTACFFVGKDKTIPCYMWEACEYDPCRGVDELHNMSLVKTRENNELWMNNQLKVLGREIVKEENPRKPFKRSRLWNREDIELVLNQRKVHAVEALSATLDNSHSFPERRFFRNFSNLRYLRMNRAIIKGNKQSAKNSRKDRGRILPRLKWLEWQWCHNISSLLALDLSDLVVLDLSWSTSRTWRCWRRIMKKAKNLKVLILKDCAWLVECPVSYAPANLERLNLEHCSTLPGVGRSISKLTNLVSLNIKFCSFVQELPKDIAALVALKELYIDGTSIRTIDFPENSYVKLEILSACNCKSLSLSNSIGNLKSLSYLALDDTELSELPYSIGLLKNLQTLSLRNCRRLWKLPDSVRSLEELQVMDLSDAIVDELPSSVKYLRNLRVLKMPRTFIREFPGGIMNLESLEEIDFSGCRCLTGECDITGLFSLRVLSLVYTDISQLIVTDRQHCNSQNLKLDGSVRISITGTTKRIQHQLNGFETMTQFPADRHRFSMPMMSQRP